MGKQRGRKTHSQGQDIGVYSVEENRMCRGLLFRAEVTESYTNQTIAPLGAQIHSLSQ
jgi:hypothetical protein